MARKIPLNVTPQEKAELINFFIQMKEWYEAGAKTRFFSSVPTDSLSIYVIALSNKITHQAFQKCKLVQNFTKLYEYQIDIAQELEVTGDVMADSE